MEKITKFIVENIASGKIERQTAIQALSILKQEKTVSDVKEIAIIGMAARFPRSKDMDEFWENIKNNVDITSSFPESRREDIDAFIRFRNLDVDDYKYFEGAYLDDIDGFDYNFFHMSPKEASLMDPNQRLLLETVIKTVEDAGYGGDKIAGTNTGVYIGVSANVIDMYSRMIYEIDPSMIPLSIVGNTPSVITGRVSYMLDLKGPSVVVDTACSSSLTALHLACQALRNGTCDMAVAGGIKIITMPVTPKSEDLGIGLSSSDGITRTFDENSDGTSLGEGVGAVLIKPLKKALEDGDNIYAVIKGIASNQDGLSASLTAPNTLSQEEVIAKAWEDAGINPETISYIEAHGTGTQLGDPIEISGIQRAFQRYTKKKQFCAVSSIKTNMGHLSEVAGMSGLFKAILSMRNSEIPAQLHLNKPNRKIDFGNSSVYVNTIPRKWENTETPRRCGVSAFGLSGTNCHVVLEEAPMLKESENREFSRYEVLTVSAKNETALERFLWNYSTFLGKNTSKKLRDICYTSNTGRGHYNYRLAVITDSIEDLKEKIEKLIESDFMTFEAPWFFYGKHRLVSSGKESRDEGDICEKERDQYTSMSQNKAAIYVDSDKADIEVLSSLCELYVKGAAINWEGLYKNEKPKKISIPVYPFKNSRCWLDLPEQGLKEDEKIEHTGDMYFSMKWRKKACEAGNNPLDGAVLILKDAGGLGAEIAAALKDEGENVIEVDFKDKFNALDDGNFIINNCEEDYFKLFESLKNIKISSIVHLLSADIEGKTDSLEDIEGNLGKGVISLYYLVRAMAANDYNYDIDLLLVSRFANEITGNEKMIVPENAALFAMGRVACREHMWMKTRYIDIDDSIGSAEILSELTALPELSASGYRMGKRYVEEFSAHDMEREETGEIDIKADGIYLISGGTGGMALEYSKYLASKGNVKLALLNRSKMPERELWDDILKDGSISPLCRKITAVREIENMGTEVFCFNADVSKIDEMKPLVENLRKRFGRINGVIHTAGIGGTDPIVSRTEGEIRNKLSPKVQGTWILDRLTRADNPDFFIMCSSVSTMFGMIGQGDYAAANAYLDSFAAYRSKNGLRTLAINWTTWKETGMAADTGFTIDTIFKALTTDEAMKGFTGIFNKNIKRSLIGEINYEGGGVFLLERSQIALSMEMKSIIEQYKAKKGAKKKPASKGQSGTGGDVRLTGKEDGNYTEIEKNIAIVCRNILGFDEIDINDNFFELGADSILLMKIHGEIDKKYEGLVAAADMFEYTTVSKLSRFISHKLSGETKEEIRVSANTQSSVKDLAVIGISVKLPLADNIEEFWENIRNSSDCVIDFPRSRREFVEKYLSFRGIPAEGVNYLQGAYLEDVDMFDYNFFKLSPKEASLTDPNQRLFLQTAWHAIEDAGYGGKRIEGTRTGVYLGFSTNIVDMYSRIIYEVDPSLLSMAIVGNTSAVTTGRLSYLLDLKGPSIVVDTACSSSLVAIHTACEAIRNGDCDMAVAGGIKLNSMPVYRDGEKSGIGMESSDGRARTFDNNSDGTGAGEGVAAVLIKPLDKALADRDNIYAVIKGNASNQDGVSASITAPNPAAQVDVILKAWQKADIDPETITYIETHGTGTQLGDPIEVKAIKDSFEKYTTRKQFCAIGSVKTNIGHLSEAAGATGFIKAVLALKNRELPPNLYFNRPNSKINFEDSAVFVNTKLKRWEPEGAIRRCAVSAFGMSGTNCHVVLEEAPRVEDSDISSGVPYILTLSAKSEEALKQIVSSYKKYLDKNPPVRIEDICFTACTGRGHYNKRLAFIIKDMEDLKDKIDRLLAVDYENSTDDWYCYGSHKIISGSRNAEFKGEITEEEKNGISKSADGMIHDFTSGVKQDSGVLFNIISLYTKGSDIDWEQLYQGKAVRKVSLPVYPFEKRKCWIGIPERDYRQFDISRGDEMYYSLVWNTEKMPEEKIETISGNVLLFKDRNNFGDGIKEKLSSQGREILEVEYGSSFEKLDNNKYIVGSCEEDYKKLIEAVTPYGISQIIHLFTLDFHDGTDEFKELENSQKRGVYSLYYLIRAIVNKGWSNLLDVLLISNDVFPVTGGEERFCPENAPLFGLGRVVGTEYANIQCRGIDIDQSTTVDDIMPDINAKTQIYQVAYRNGKRYLEEFRDIDIEYQKPDPVDIRPDGVYLITGGTGGMGLTVAGYIASKARANLVLVSRSGLPNRESWEDIINEQGNSKTAQKVKALIDLESSCTGIDYCKADLSNLDDVSHVLQEVRKKYGTINGIFHCAGLAGDGFIIRRDEEKFSGVVLPKVYGTWAFDRLTRDMELDFYVMFSSIATTLSGPGQGDYVAANAYMDAYAHYRKLKVGKTLALNWAAWRDTGMAVDYGVNVDGMFKAIPTEKALTALDKALNKDIARVIVGEINHGSELLCMLENVPLKLSYKINNAIEKANKIFGKGSDSKQKRGSGEVKLKGKEEEGYNEVEDKLALIYSEVLGFSEINIYDSFFELGGDSVLLGRMHMMIEKEFPGKVKLTELFEYTSIFKLAQYISSEEEIEIKTADDEKNLEDEIANLMDLMEKGDLSLDDAVDSLKKI